MIKPRGKGSAALRIQLANLPNSQIYCASNGLGNVYLLDAVESCDHMGSGFDTNGGNGYGISVKMTATMSEYR